MKRLLFGLITFWLLSVQFLQAQQRNPSAQRSTTQNSLRSTGSNSLVPASSYQRQQNLPSSNDWRNMNTREKKEAVSNMSSKERMTFFQNMKESMLIKDLTIPDAKQNDFKTLYEEYQESQRNIKDKFKGSDANADKLSDEEAMKRLNQSFDIGQQLLDNRKSFSQKFLKILTPQQLLKLYQTEGKFRQKVLDKKHDN